MTRATQRGAQMVSISACTFAGGWRSGPAPAARPARSARRWPCAGLGEPALLGGVQTRPVGQVHPPALAQHHRSGLKRGQPLLVVGGHHLAVGGGRASIPHTAATSPKRRCWSRQTRIIAVDRGQPGDHLILGTQIHLLHDPRPALHPGRRRRVQVRPPSAALLDDRRTIMGILLFRAPLHPTRRTSRRSGPPARAPQHHDQGYKAMIIGNSG